jgi:hypothetical protein
MLASALTLSRPPTIIMATSGHSSKIIRQFPPPAGPLPRWLRVLLQPWKWNRACWDDEDDFSDGVNERDSDDGVILVSSPVSSVNHERQSITTRKEDMSMTKKATVQQTEPKSPDSIAPSRPHLQTIDSAFHEMPPLLPHGCPREIYIQPRVSHATSANRPTALHHSDRLGSFETALTESEDDDTTYQHGDEDYDSASAGTASHNDEGGLPRPLGASRCSSLPFRPPRPEQARGRALSTSVPPPPPLFGRDRANTYSSVTTTSSRHRRWKISISPQSVQQIYNKNRSKMAENKESRDDVCSTEPDPVVNSPTGIHCFDDKKSGDDEVAFYHQDCVPAPTQQKLDNQEWMHRWVDMKPEENPVSTSPTSSTLATSKTTVLCSPELPTKGDPSLYYWCKDESLGESILPQMEEQEILLEGLVLFESSETSSASPCRSAYLTVVRSSPKLYLVDNSDKVCTTWTPPASHLNMSVHMRYRSKAEGYCVVVNSSSATLVTLVPLSSKKRRRLDETAQHNAALHLWFVLDTWRRQQQQQQQQHLAQTRSQATVRYASWDEAQVRAIEQRLLLISKT